jgi:CheY-like chemotaxis protein
MKILFVDDERTPTEYFVNALRADHKVNFVRMAADAKKEVAKADDFDYDAVILDIMMPPGPYAAESPDGLRTGLYILRDLRLRHPEIPVIALTNAVDPALLEALQLQPNVKTLDKTQILPSALPEIVKAVVEAR